MLEGLDAIDWKHFKDDHGKAATDVPKRLRALYSPIPAARDRALDALHARLFTLGTINDATVAAIPFLAELGVDEALPDRAAVLGFVHALLTALPENDRSGFASAVAQEEPGVARALRAAVRKATPRFASCATASEAPIRSAAAALLALAPATKKSLAAIRRAHAREDDSDARASQLLALGLLARRTSSHDDRPTLLEALGDEAALVRVASAIGLAYLAPADVPDEALDELALAAALPDRPSASLCWNGGRVAVLAALALGEVARSSRARALPRLRSMLARRFASMPAPPPQEPTAAEQMFAAMTGQAPPAREPSLPDGVREIAEELLRAALGDLAGSLDHDVVASDLDDAGRAALVDLAIDRGLDGPYARFGLPSLRDFPRWLGRVPARGLERVLVVDDASPRPVWSLLRDARRGRVAESELTLSLERSLDQEARTQIVRDVLEGAYACPGDDLVLRADQLGLLARLLPA